MTDTQPNREAIEAQTGDGPPNVADPIAIDWSAALHRDQEATS